MRTNLRFAARSPLEKFAEKVYTALVENSEHSYFVGGWVRDALLGRANPDFDIATDLQPARVREVLKKAGVPYDSAHEKFGVISALSSAGGVEITTFRSDEYARGRHPSVRFVPNAKTDSSRRDFTINALYFKPTDGDVLDFHGGLKDLAAKAIRLIGNPDVRLREDPLRIMRALRFSLALNFSIEKKTFTALKNNFSLLASVSENKKNQELQKNKTTTRKKIVKKVINNPEDLDKYFQMS